MTTITVLAAPLAAIGRQWRRRRQRQQWKHRRREFVYLDETSVISLIAARHGSVPESFKETLTATSSSQTGSTVSVPSTPATPGGAVSGRSSMTRTTSQEVVRRAVIQGIFRTLRIGDTDLKLSVDDQPDNSRATAASALEDLTRQLKRLQREHRAIKADDLVRGDVVEVRVRLTPESSYELTAAVSSMIDLIEGRAAMFGIEESTVAEVQHALALMSRLLVDLVPLQAELVSHRLVVIDGQSWLVDASIIEGGSQLADESTAVHLAGVTELPLYWKDVRRVLFAGSTYSVYARVSRPGVQSTWSPVKLANVFDRILPEVSEQIRRLPHLFDEAPAVDEAAGGQPVSQIVEQHALLPFGRELASTVSREVSEAALREAAQSAAQRLATPGDLADVGNVRRAFEEMVRVVEDSPAVADLAEDGLAEQQIQVAIDRQLVRTLRDRHHLSAQLKLVTDSTVEVARPADQPDEAVSLIEAEVVGIYW